MKYPNPVSLGDIYEAFRDFRYIIPQGGPMTGIGNDFQIASLSDCFVIGNKGDSDSCRGHHVHHLHDTPSKSLFGRSQRLLNPRLHPRAESAGVGPADSRQ